MNVYNVWHQIYGAKTTIEANSIREAIEVYMRKFGVDESSAPPAKIERIKKRINAEVVYEQKRT